MSDLDELIFRGTNAQDCEDFIRGIRRAALSRGKEEDNRWSAHYASSCLAGSALRWFEELDEDIQYDWRRLRKAMLERWPDNQDDLRENFSTLTLVPASPAAAPPPAPSGISRSKRFENLSSTLQRGYIRVDGILSDRKVYIFKKRNVLGSFRTTLEAHERMLVEIEVQAPPYRMKVFNVRNCTWLALKWKYEPLIGKGSAGPAEFVGLNESDEFHCKEGRHDFTGSHCATVWSVGIDGTIQAWWEDGATSLMEPVYRQTDHRIAFASDPEAYIQRHPNWKRVRLIFEAAS